MSTATEWRHRLEVDGFIFLPAVFSSSEVQRLREDAARALSAPAAGDSILGADGPPHGARNLLRIWPDVANVVRKKPLAERLCEILGNDGGIVRGLWFDKPSGQGWALPWHRDQTVAVRTHGVMQQFAKPTFKAGVPHVQAPLELLTGMITARVHLDAMTDSNGPLRVIPGSHRVETSIVENGGETLHCDAGDVLLIRPLLLHASAGCAAGHSGHRRVIHLEFARSPQLPDDYEWHTFVPIGN